MGQSFILIKKLGKIFSKNKNIAILSFNPETNHRDSKNYLFMNSLVENVQLIDSSIKNWINRGI